MCAIIQIIFRSYYFFSACNGEIRDDDIYQIVGFFAVMLVFHVVHFSAETCVEEQ